MTGNSATLLLFIFLFLYDVLSFVRSIASRKSPFWKENSGFRKQQKNQKKVIIQLSVIKFIQRTQTSSLKTIRGATRNSWNVNCCTFFWFLSRVSTLTRDIDLAVLSVRHVAVFYRNDLTWSWYTGRWRVGWYIWYSEEETGRGSSPPRPLLAILNVTAHPSTVSVPITVLLYNDALLCGFNVAIEGLNQ